ncbi:hypothetical protein SELMODRAFT_428163 [Selaginella moellendorffii]|uniref:C3H1-type domain-containing protein n=1 Tax=Selaginella moellendorffii TaxID=88036 RepID=D8T1Y5_SELML|nr:hypothetical protein SELMODRAFT_428163 [Selaginella moellendorffii]
MTKANFDKECKICARPFTVFRWKAGRDSRYKKTEICQTCSKLQRSDVNREYFAEEHDRKVDHESSFGKVRPNDMILKLQRTSPYYKRNRAHVCSFFVRGGCQRGDACPYRHEMPVTGELSHYGLNDPVAAKLLKKAEEMSTLTPDDATVRTLYVGGLDERVTTEDLKDNFYSYGEIESLRLVPQRACAFITYTTREDAEKAAEDLSFKHQSRTSKLLKWQEIKPKLGAAWPSAKNGFQLAVYLDELNIFLYGGYFKEPASDKDQSDKGEKIRYGSWAKSRIFVHQEMSHLVWWCDSLHSVFMIEMYKCASKAEESGRSKCGKCVCTLSVLLEGCCLVEESMLEWDTLFLYGCMKEVGEKEVTLDDLFLLDLNKLDVLNEEDGETDNDNSDAGSISKGTDEEDDGKVVKKKDVELGLADSQQTPLELRKDGFELAKTCYRELKPVLDKLVRLEAAHNAEEEATKPSKERSKKKQ